jgi:cardiolipin synthase
MGIKLIAFSPVLPIVNFLMNYRDHRKILVIDGKVGYTGGINIADEYINVKKYYGVWKDASVKIEGESVDGLTLMFLRMWEYSSRDKIDYSKYLRVLRENESDNCIEDKEAVFQNNNEVTAANIVDEKAIILPYGDGPSEKTPVGRDIYCNIIGNAQKTLYIMTPYLIVESAVLDLIKSKAQSGVDVRIIIPGTPDKKMAYSLTLFNARKLIQSGVKIYTYTPGFIHSKVVFSDDECAVVGSINLDFRSFYQQYESAVYLANTSALTEIKNDFINTFNESKQLVLSEMKKNNIFSSIVLTFLRFISPLM